MTEKEKELKAFNQCADALNALDKKSIFKVFQLLSIHFEVMPLTDNGQKDSSEAASANYLLSHSPDQDFENDENKIDQREVKKSSPSKRTKASSTTKSPIFLADYDFRPPQKEALKDYYAKFKIDTNYENNLLFIYYLQEIVKEEVITLNHVFSCYRHLGLKIPSFPQSIKDTKKAKGWINTNPSDLKVSRAGINYLEHEMKKSND